MLYAVTVLFLTILRTSSITFMAGGASATISRVMSVFWKIQAFLW